MAIRVLVIVGHGRMGAAFRRSLGPTYPHPQRVSGREAAAGRVTRPSPHAITWILAVPDRVVADVTAGLAKVLGPRDVVLHLAGMLGPEVLDVARASGAAVGSLHPLAAVASPRPRPSLAGTSFLFQGDRPARAESRRIATAVGGRLLVATTVDRARYHGAAALVATGGVALAQGAAWMLSLAVTPAPGDTEVRAAVASLLRSVARNVEAVGVRRALASPLVRNDVASVERHLAAMAADPSVRGLYLAAVARVLKPLEEEGLVSAETLASARKLVGPHDP